MTVRSAGPPLLVAQPAIPNYREPLFSALARQYPPGIVVMADGRRSLALAGNSFVTPGDFRTVHAPVRIAGPWWLQAGVTHSLLRDKYSGAILSWNIRQLDLWPNVRIARHRSIPTVLWGHGLSKGLPFAREKARQALARAADVVAVYGDRAKDLLVASGFADDRVVVARNGIDTIGLSRIAGSGVDDDRWRHTLRIGDRHVLLHIGRLLPERRLEVALHALSLSKELQQSAVLIVVGGGSHASRLQESASSLGVQESIRLLGPIYDDRTVAELAQLASVAIFPSHVGLSLLHMAALGTPAICGDDWRFHGPEFEALTPGSSGWTFRHGEATDLVGVLADVLGDTEERQRRGCHAQATVMTHYSVDSTARGLLMAVQRAGLR